MGRPLSIVTVSLSGRELRRVIDARRYELLARCVREVCRKRQWRPLDALLLPAGALRVDGRYVDLTEPQRLAELDASEAGSVCTALAQRLSHASAGCLLVAGMDSPRRGSWRGDLMVATFLAAGPIAVTRMIYPVRGDHNLVHPDDSDTPGRVVRLPSGRTAWVCVCYDAFALAELVSGDLGRRGNLRHVMGETGRARQAREGEGEAVELLNKLRRQLKRAKPDVALAAIHRFERPGRELLWQRHGLATASAALGGRLVVGASHFTEALPTTPVDSPLSAFGVARAHLTLGGRRPACEHPPVDGFYVSDTEGGPPRALVRLYRAP